MIPSGAKSDDEVGRTSGRSEPEGGTRSASADTRALAGLDAHCHLDHYPDPYAMAQEVERARILTVAVTNSPAAFLRAHPHVRPLRHIRLAVGLHPLEHELHDAGRADIRAAFRNCLARTSYVGEVGLDFTREGRAWRDAQVASFRFVLEQLVAVPKFVTLHSRGAEAAILDLLEEYAVGPVVFHWYTGPIEMLSRLLAHGHSCSVTPAMLRSPRGRSLVSAMPPDRVLTETDGPFCRIGIRPASPTDVTLIERELAGLWGVREGDVRSQVMRNFLALARRAQPS